MSASLWWGRRDPVKDEAGARTGWKANIFSYPPIGSPADRAHVTAGDLVTFAQAVRAGRLLTPELTEAFLTPQVLHHARAGHEIWYGYGLEFVCDPDGTVRSQYKDGDNTGALGIFRYYPAPEPKLIIGKSGILFGSIARLPMINLGRAGWLTRWRTTSRSPAGS